VRFVGTRFLEKRMRPHSEKQTLEKESIMKGKAPPQQRFKKQSTGSTPKEEENWKVTRGGEKV